jgi:signal transduction histidine kinase
VADLFSPRPSSKGGGHQGVGLSIVREILSQWNATILCRSQPGSGTSFQIFLPLEHSV